MSVYDHKKYSLDLDIHKRLVDALGDGDRNAVLAILAGLKEADIAEFLVIASSEQRDELISLLGKDLKPQVLLQVDPHLREMIIDSIGVLDVVDIIKSLAEDDIIYLIKDIDVEMRDAIIDKLPVALHKVLYHFLSYPEESAGRLVSKNVVAVPDNWKVGNVMDMLRDGKKLPERFYQVFVLDNNRHPIGYLDINVIVASEHDVPIRDIMKIDLRVLRADMNQEEASHIFMKYELISAPVVNEAGIMIGVITFEDIMEVIKSEAEQDILHLGGVLENDMYSGVIGTITKRLPWLTVNILMAMTTSVVISVFDGTIEKIVVLAVLMPIIASTGGNAGIQSVTVTMQALTRKEITSVNRLRIIVKEMLSGMGSGLIIACCSFVVILLMFHKATIAVLFSCSVIAVFTLSSLIGSSTPLVLHYMGVDPAVSSSIIVTTCTDILSYSTFLGLATLFLL